MDIENILHCIFRGIVWLVVFIVPCAAVSAFGLFLMAVSGIGGFWPLGIIIGGAAFISGVVSATLIDERLFP